MPPAAPRGRAAGSSSRLLVVALLAALGIAGFTALGLWQIERRAWKHDLIARVDARIHAAPVAAPGPGDWPAISRDTDEYRRVSASGHFLNQDETLVKAVTDRGSGYWVLTPLATDRGFTILVNRGFIPDAARDVRAQSAPRVVEGETTVTGLLRITEPKGGFLRENDAAADRWFSRDVAAIAAAHGLADTAPYFIDAEARPGAEPADFPVAGLTVVSFPDNHLVYALTWFALALMTAGAAWIVFRHERRRRLRQGD